MLQHGDPPGGELGVGQVPVLLTHRGGVPGVGRRWSHLVSDADYEELLAFVAEHLGIPRRAFQGDHYDVPEELYAEAVAGGAEPVGSRELLSRLVAAGLRLKKTRNRPT